MEWSAAKTGDWEEETQGAERGKKGESGELRGSLGEYDAGLRHF